MKAVLLFSTNKGIVARLIRWFTWSKFSHVDVIFYHKTYKDLEKEYNVMIGVNMLPGVNFVDITTRLAHSTETEYVELPGVDGKALYDTLLEQVGKKYDFAALFGLLAEKNGRTKNGGFVLS